MSYTVEFCFGLAYFFDILICAASFRSAIPDFLYFSFSYHFYVWWVWLFEDDSFYLNSSSVTREIFFLVFTQHLIWYIFSCLFHVKYAPSWKKILVLVSFFGCGIKNKNGIKQNSFFWREGDLELFSFQRTPVLHPLFLLCNRGHFNLNSMLVQLIPDYLFFIPESIMFAFSVCDPSQLNFLFHLWLYPLHSLSLTLEDVSSHFNWSPKYYKGNYEYCYWSEWKYDEKGYYDFGFIFDVICYTWF